MSDEQTRTRRFYLSPLPGRAGEEAALSPAEAHHALHVLRLKAGAAIEAFDGRGGAARGVVSAVRRADVTVAISEILPPQPQRRPLVHIGFAEPKGKRLDWLLEKATELGAASLTPVRFARAVAGRNEMTDSRRGLWLVHCIAAAKQCGLNLLPDLLAPMTLDAFLSAGSEDLRVLGDASATAQPLR